MALYRNPQEIIEEMYKTSIIRKGMGGEEIRFSPQFPPARRPLVYEQTHN